MPDMAGIDLGGESEGGSRKTETEMFVNPEEMALAGVGAEDILASGVDLDQDRFARDAYFDEAMMNVDLRLMDIDVVSRQLGYTGNEGAAGDLFMAASTTGDKLGVRNANISEDVDELQQGRFGSQEVALSATHREAGWDVYDPDNEHGIWQVGHRHDQDGIDSDFRATINGYALSMNAMGVDWEDLNKALGPMGNLEQMREALSGLNEIAGSRAGFAGFGAFFQALDSEMFSMQKAEDPKGDVKPALGTPEPEVEPPQYTLNTPTNDPNGPNNNPGMSPAAPTIRV